MSTSKELAEAISGSSDEESVLSERAAVRPGSVNWGIVDATNKRLVRALKGRDAIEALALARKLTKALQPVVMQ